MHFCTGTIQQKGGKKNESGKPKRTEKKKACQKVQALLACTA